jgi:hypothetical protein
MEYYNENNGKKHVIIIGKYFKKLFFCFGESSALYRYRLIEEILVSDLHVRWDRRGRSGGNSKDQGSVG